MLLRMALTVRRILLLLRLLVWRTFATTTAAAAAAAMATFALTLIFSTLSTMAAMSMLLAPVLLRRNGNPGALLQHAADNLRGAPRGGFVFGVGRIVMSGRCVPHERLRFVFVVVVAAVALIWRAGFRW